MKKSTNLRHGRHCVFALHVHLVFVTKYRRRVFTKKTIFALKEIFRSVCAQFEAKLIEFDGEADHVHLLVNYPPKITISKLVNSLKGVSSRLLRKAHPEMASKYWKGVLWSPSYFAASCGGAPISIIKQYIENQKTPTD
jgi:putative transposase